ncbi:MAG TPA: hypothetical protein DHO02_05225 [Syntrophaceae bacterium]|jgi:hypothetical protein|nr:hypothetical protein [Syntrophaceae bacterium]
MVQVPLKGRENQHETLCEDLLRERAAVLARAGFAVEDALEKLVKIDRQLEEKLRDWRLRQDDPADKEDLQKPQSVIDDVNEIIDQFNVACQKAEIQYYYLIVTREALGLRRHETVQKLYQVPPKKKKMQAI